MKFALAASQTSVRRTDMEIGLFWYEVAYVNNH